MADEQEPLVQSADRARVPGPCKFKVEGMYLPKPGNRPFISENTDAMQQTIPLEKVYLKEVELRSNMKQKNF